MDDIMDMIEIDSIELGLHIRALQQHLERAKSATSERARRLALDYAAIEADYLQAFVADTRAERDSEQADQP
jgi:hypothetical protein